MISLLCKSRCLTMCDVFSKNLIVKNLRNRGMEEKIVTDFIFICKFLSILRSCYVTIPHLEPKPIKETIFNTTNSIKSTNNPTTAIQIIKPVVVHFFYLELNSLIIFKVFCFVFQNLANKMFTLPSWSLVEAIFCLQRFRIVLAYFSIYEQF